MKARAFTLIEMLIVLLVLSVLAAVAMPAWQEYVVRTRRYEAQATMQRLMLQQERYFTQNGAYLAFSATASATDVEAGQFQWWSGASAPLSGYELEGKACEGATLSECLQLVATPGTARVDARFRDPACAVLTLTSSGLRLASGQQAQCWR